MNLLDVGQYENILSTLRWNIKERHVAMDPVQKRDFEECKINVYFVILKSQRATLMK